MMTAALEEAPIRGIFVRIKIAFQQVFIWRAIGEVVHDVTAGGVRAHRHHILPGGLGGMINKIKNHAIVDRMFVNSQQLAVSRGTLSSGLNRLVMFINLIQERHRLLDFLESKHRRPRQLLLHVARLDAAAAMGKVKTARHGKGQRAFHRAQRHIEIAPGISAINLQRAGHTHGHTNKAQMIFNESLEILGAVQGKLRHLMPRLFLEPLLARLRVRLSITPRWCQFIHRYRPNALTTRQTCSVGCHGKQVSEIYPAAPVRPALFTRSPTQPSRQQHQRRDQRAYQSHCQKQAEMNHRRE